MSDDKAPVREDEFWLDEWNFDTEGLAMLITSSSKCHVYQNSNRHGVYYGFLIEGTFEGPGSRGLFTSLLRMIERTRSKGDGRPPTADSS